MHMADTARFPPGRVEIGKVESSQEQISGTVLNGPLGQVLDLDDQRSFPT